MSPVTLDTSAHWNVQNRYCWPTSGASVCGCVGALAWKWCVLMGKAGSVLLENRGSGEWEDAKEQTKAGYKSNPQGDSETCCMPWSLPAFQGLGHQDSDIKIQWKQEGRNEIMIILWDKNHLGIQTGQNDNLNFTSNWSLNVWGHGNHTGRSWNEKEQVRKRAGGPHQHNEEDECIRHNLRRQGGNKKWTKMS